MFRTSSAVACAFLAAISAGLDGAEEPSPCVRTIADADIHIFYDRSFYDGTTNPPACQARAGHLCTDDDAIDPSKSALLPGAVATTGKYSAYLRGINGIMIDVGHGSECLSLPAGPLDVGTFDFRMGNAASLAGFVVAPLPTSINVTPGGGAGGADRIVLKWADNAIPNRTWLRVAVKSELNGGLPGLASDKVFYFGLAIGDSCTPGTSRVIVNSVDEVDCRNHPRSAGNRAPVSWNWDTDKSSVADGSVEGIIARNNLSSAGTGLLYYGNGTTPVAP